MNEKFLQNIAPVLAIVVTFGFFAVLAFLAARGIPENQSTRDILTMLVGALTAQFANVLGYYFGSSRGSTEKDAVIATQMRRTAQPLPPTTPGETK